MFSANMVRQYSFLNQLMTDLETDAAKVCRQKSWFWGWGGELK